MAASGDDLSMLMFLIDSRVVNSSFFLASFLIGVEAQSLRENSVEMVVGCRKDAPSQQRTMLLFNELPCLFDSATAVESLRSEADRIIGFWWMREPLGLVDVRDERIRIWPVQIPVGGQRGPKPKPTVEERPCGIGDGGLGDGRRMDEKGGGGEEKMKQTGVVKTLELQLLELSKQQWWDGDAGV